MPLPGPTDDTGSPSAGHNGSQQHIAVTGDLGELGGESGSGDDGICTALNGGPDIVGIVLHCHHHIDTHQAAASGDLLGSGDLLLEAALVDLQRVVVKIGGPVTGMGGRDHTHAAAGCHRTGQAGEGNSYTHSPLDNRDGKFTVTSLHSQSQSFARSFFSSQNEVYSSSRIAAAGRIS